VNKPFVEFAPPTPTSVVEAANNRPEERSMAKEAVFHRA
jgi:hypothetical protein